tara:strand:- start:77 stop:310 length:234 start_codon:yes stop_codon:yes gene_type:complete
MELLNIWVVTVVLSFLNAPDYKSTYQKVKFNSENLCQEFLHDNLIILEHDLIHVFETQKEELIKINFDCEIIKGEEV